VTGGFWPRYVGVPRCTAAVGFSHSHQQPRRVARPAPSTACTLQVTTYLVTAHRWQRAEPLTYRSENQVVVSPPTVIAITTSKLLPVKLPVHN